MAITSGNIFHTCTDSKRSDQPEWLDKIKIARLTCDTPENFPRHSASRTNGQIASRWLSLYSRITSDICNPEPVEQTHSWDRRGLYLLAGDNLAGLEPAPSGVSNQSDGDVSFGYSGATRVFHSRRLAMRQYDTSGNALGSSPAATLVPQIGSKSE